MSQFENSLELARLELVRRVQEIHAPQLLRYPNVVGIGTGFRQQSGYYTGDLAVQVLVSRKYPESELPDWAILPDQIRGERMSVRVDVIDVGFIHAGVDTTRYRPVEAGCSIGHQSLVDAGTLGAWAGDKGDGTIVLLTCNHVIAALGAAAQPGGIVQAGQLDGGTVPNDIIGTLKRFVPIATVNTATFPPPPPPPVTPADAAIGTITVSRTDDVLQIAPAIYEVGTPSLNMTVKKRGRTTGLTTNGQITSVNVQVSVNYNNNLSGTIGNAFIITSTDQQQFANRGDSGSVIFNTQVGNLQGTYPAVGLYFAVSNNGLTGFANDINAVFSQLNLETVCAALVNALLQAIGSGATSGAAGSAGASLSSETKLNQLRKLRDEVMASRPGGAMLLDLLAPQVPLLTHAFLVDEEAFGLLARLVEPWVTKPTNLDVLDARIDEATVTAANRLAERIVQISPELADAVAVAADVLASAEGRTVRELFEQGFTT